MYSNRDNSLKDDSSVLPGPNRRLAVLLAFAVGASVSLVAVKLAKLLLVDGVSVGVSLELAPGALLRRLMHVVQTSQFCRLLALVLVAWLAMRIPPPRARVATATIPIALFLVWRLVGALLTGRPVLADSWLLSRMLALGGGVLEELSFLARALRLDLLVCLVYSTVGLTVMCALSRSSVAWMSRVLQGFALVLCVVLGLDLALFAKTGLAAASQYLGYGAQALGGLLPLVRHELDVVVFSALAWPLVSYLIASRVVARRVRTARAGNRWDIVKPLGILSAIQMAVLAMPVGQQPAIGSGSGAADLDERLIHNAVVDVVAQTRRSSPLSRAITEAAAVAEREPLLFSTDKVITRGATGSPLRRDVVLFILETTRVDATTLHAPFPPTTPVLQGLARKGARVEALYATGPWTTAAWTAMLRGIWPTNSQMLDRWTSAPGIASGAATLPALLRQQGYASAFMTPSTLRFMDDGSYIRPLGFDTVVSREAIQAQGVEPLGYMGLEDRAVVGPAVAWAQAQRAAGVPFLLVVQSAAAHHPWRAPVAWQRNAYNTIRPAPYPEYLNAVAYTDAVLGDLLDGLGHGGAHDSTIVIVMADHGEGFGDHDEINHGRLLYEETIRVPAVLYAPGLITPGTRITGLRQQIDVVPTILDLLNLETSQGDLPGISLVASVPEDRTLYFTAESPSGWVGMRQGRLKFHLELSTGLTKVFDLAQDPLEADDIASRMSERQIEDARTAILKWRAQVIRAMMPWTSN